jgi:hypothetical protein
VKDTAEEERDLWEVASYFYTSAMLFVTNFFLAGGSQWNVVKHIQHQVLDIQQHPTFTSKLNLQT